MTWMAMGSPRLSTISGPGALTSLVARPGSLKESPLAFTPPSWFSTHEIERAPRFRSLHLWMLAASRQNGDPHNQSGHIPFGVIVRHRSVVHLGIAPEHHRVWLHMRQDMTMKEPSPRFSRLPVH